MLRLTSAQEFTETGLHHLKGYALTTDNVAEAHSKGEEVIGSFKSDTRLLNGELYSARLGIYYIEVPYSDQVDRYAWRLTRFPEAGSPADNCGLELFDKIIALNSMPFTDPTPHLNFIADPLYKPGDTYASLRNRRPESMHGKNKLDVIDCRKAIQNETTIELP